MKQVRVAIFKPGEEPVFESIRNDLSTMQKIVGGYIEMVRLSQGLALMCNEEGKLDGLESNRLITAFGNMDMVCGTFFVFRPAGAGMRDLMAADEERLKLWRPGRIWNTAYGELEDE